MMRPVCRGDEMERKVVRADCEMSLDSGEGLCVRGGEEVLL